MPPESTTPPRQDLESLKAFKQEFDSVREQAARAGGQEQAELIKKARAIYQQIQQGKQALEAKLWPYESKLAKETLTNQYLRLKEAYLQTGLITKELPRSEEAGIIYKNQEYTFPSLEGIIRTLTKDQARREILKTKLEQGLVRLHITPMLAIPELKDKLGQAILKHKRENKLFKTKHNPTDPDEELDLDTNNPLYIYAQFTDDNLVYYPKAFEPNNHQGLTKDQVIQQATFPGYNVMLIEDDLFLAQEGQGQIKANRKQLENNQTPIQYLETIQTKPEYASEQGWTIEDWLSYFLYNLEITNQVSNDWDDNNAIWLIGNYLPTTDLNASGVVPEAYWLRDNRQASVGWNFPGDRLQFWGARAAVRV